MTAPHALADQLARHQHLLDLERAKLAVADAQVREIQAVADSLAERLSHLLVALADCDVVVVRPADLEPRVMGFDLPGRSLAARTALGAAITAARTALDDYHGIDGEAA